MRFIYWIPKVILALKNIHTLSFLVLLLATLTSMPINYTFAAEDLDNDGIDDSVDSCPNLQEDYVGPADGCPSDFVPWYDEDYDGIQDHLDQCPNIRENYNGFQDEDGCPDTISEGGAGGLPDSDGDGFVDTSRFMSKSTRNIQWCFR